jgi:hypothetical protein
MYVYIYFNYCRPTMRAYPMTIDALTLEQIREMTDRAVHEGRIPSIVACDAHGQQSGMVFQNETA